MTGALLLAGLGAVPTPGPAAVAAGGGKPSAADTLALTPIDSHGVRVNRRARIAAQFPTTVATGARIRVAGVAALGSRAKRVRRPVRLVERVGRRWIERAQVRARRTGTFVLVTRAGDRERTRTYRAVAPRFRGLAAAVTPARRVLVRVTTPVEPPPPPPEEPSAEPPPPAPEEPPTEPTSYTPLGSPDDWSFLRTGGSRWDSCEVIEWRYNPTGQRYPALDDVHEAMRRIAERTGLRFSYVGSTDYVPVPDQRPPSTADFFVSWADETQVPSLAGTTVGLGGGWSRPISGEDVAAQITIGYLALDRTHDLRTGHHDFGTVSWGQVIDHEVLHALGLGHAKGPEQVMHGAVSSLNHRFGAGDLTGMARIGKVGPCP